MSYAIIFALGLLVGGVCVFAALASRCADAGLERERAESLARHAKTAIDAHNAKQAQFAKVIDGIKTQREELGLRADAYQNDLAELQRRIAANSSQRQELERQTALVVSQRTELERQAAIDKRQHEEFDERVALHLSQRADLERQIALFNGEREKFKIQAAAYDLDLAKRRQALEWQTAAGVTKAQPAPGELGSARWRQAVNNATLPPPIPPQARTHVPQPGLLTGTLPASEQPQTHQVTTPASNPPPVRIQAPPTRVSSPPPQPRAQGTSTASAIFSNAGSSEKIPPIQGYFRGGIARRVAATAEKVSSSPGPSDETAQPLDHTAIARKTKETREVQEILGRFMEGLTLGETASASPSPPTASATNAHLPSTIAAGPGIAVPVQSSGSPPGQYAALYNLLVARPEWRTAEAEALARQNGMMLGGAIEAINEWSVDVHGGPIFYEEPGRLKVDTAFLN